MKDSQSHRCGEASADAEVFAGQDAEPSAAARLSDDQFWTLERWIIAHANAAAMPAGFHDPAQLQAIRDTAYTALTGKEPA